MKQLVQVKGKQIIASRTKQAAIRRSKIDWYEIWVYKHADEVLSWANDLDTDENGNVIITSTEEELRAYLRSI